MLLIQEMLPLVAFCQFWYQLSSSLNLQADINLREKLHCMQPDSIQYCSGAVGIPPCSPHSWTKSEIPVLIYKSLILLVCIYFKGIQEFSSTDP